MPRDAGGRRSRGGGAASRRAARTQTTVKSAPVLRRRVPLYEAVSEEGISIIERNADTVLAEVGVNFINSPAALARWKEAGAEVDGERLRFPRGMLRELILTAPEQFVQHARNPERSVEIGGSNTVFAPVYGPPFVRDLEGERRYATIEDFRDLVKLTWMSPHLHHSGGTVCEPTDIPVNKRHLDMVYSHIRYSDKPFMGSVTAASRAADSVEMAKILFGESVVEENAVLINLINLNSPLVLDDTMIGSLEVYAAANQACVVSPFIVGGAMSPVAVAGTLAQILAEVLVAAAYTQLIRPGAPVVFGAFVATIDMNSGAPTFGTPEASHILYGAGQLARRLGIPFRSGGGLCGSKLPDAQAAYESALTLFPTVTAGANFVLHSAGWLEGGLVASPEKLVMDADQLGGLQKFAGGVDLSENGQAMDAIREVGPGQHFLGCAHTQANFETAFWRSEIADYRPFETWSEDGSPDTQAIARNRCKAMLAQYEAPDLDPAIDEALQAFIARRKAEEPDALV